MKKTKNTKIHLVNRGNRGKIDTPNIQIHDHQLFWLGTDTSIKVEGVKLVLWARPNLSS